MAPWSRDRRSGSLTCRHRVCSAATSLDAPVATAATGTDVRRLDIMLGYGAGCVSALLIGGAIADVRAQAESAVHLCVAADGVMTLASGPQCGANQKDLYFQQSSGAPGSAGQSPASSADTGAGNGSPNGDSAAMTKRLNDLERALRELEDAAR